MKKILSLILVICILMMPFSIIADNTTYIDIPANSCTLLITDTDNDKRYYKTSVDTRAVFLTETFNYNSRMRLAFVSNNNTSFNVYYGYNTCDNMTNQGSSNSYVDGNINSQVFKETQNYYPTWSYDAPVIQSNSYQNSSTAYYYTFGDGAVGSEPVQSWGLLNIRFNTDISTHDAGENQDNISWTSWDSNGNYIGDKQIEIRAVPGYYEAQDKPSLLQLKFINWVRESNLEVQVYKGSVVPEYKTFTWNYVAGLFSSIKTWQGKFWSIFASDDYWYQYGWIYEARILDTDDNPLSEWQEIVTGTASSPKDTEIIETSDELTPELYNVIYNINVYNDYQENWQINNTTINMQPDETLENDKPWWVVLLEGILSILDKLLEMLMKLFISENLTLPDFTNQTNQYMNNTGIFGQSIQFINDTHTTFQSIQNADPVISVPAITYDNTTLIPAQSWNLNTLVNDYGLSDLHNMVYLVTDGFVYIGLIILIRRKVIEVLKK